MLAVGPYRIPHVAAEAHTVYTNRTPAGSVRAPGGPQMCWAVEQHTDVIAERLGLDPVEVRRRNLVRAGDTGPTGQVFAAPAALECLERAVELALDGARSCRGRGARRRLLVVVQPLHRRRART